MKITEYLSCQHYVFMEQLAFLEGLKTSHMLNDAAGIREVVFSIANAVEKHAELEEEYLFPELEPHLGKEGGPIAVMEFEHEEIRRIVDTLRKAQDSHAIQIETVKFIVFLRDHFAKEEKVLFPMAEDLVNQHNLEVAGAAAHAHDRTRLNFSSEE